MHVDEQEGTLGQIIRPIESAGVYVPAGTAPLPSSLLMAAVIARVAASRPLSLALHPIAATAVSPMSYSLPLKSPVSMRSTAWAVLKR